MDDDTTAAAQAQQQQEEAQQLYAPPAIYAAISKVMREMAKEGISKSRTNEQQKYKFRGIDDVYNALAVPLAGSGICILPRVLGREVVERESKTGSALFYVALDMEFDFVCAADGSKHTVRVCGEAMDSGDKATNKAMSAAFKYACMQAFCIPTEGDNDADATTHEVRADPRGEARQKADRRIVTRSQNAITEAVKNDDAKKVREVLEYLQPTDPEKGHQDEWIVVWDLLQKREREYCDLVWDEVLHERMKQAAA